MKDSDILKPGGTKTVQASEDLLSLRGIKHIMSGDKLYFGEPRWFNINGEKIFGSNIAAPLVDKKGKVLGVLGMIFDMKVLANDFNDPSRSVFEGDRRILLSNGGIIATHPNADFVTRKITDVNKNAANVIEVIQKAQVKSIDYIADDGSKYHG
ncbi:TPA: cache domain-containing protein, partial [Campylobacter lari]|nr:cache domain-containing protein [Campylobacter lari]